jgi:CCR4-NOT transcription complex subunit 4
MSTAARALLDDLKARRDHTAPVTQPAPFPDFDRTLQFLSGGGEDTGGFHFALDPSLTRGVPDAESFGLPEMPDYRAEGDIPFNGNFFTAFPAMKPIGQGANGVPAAPPGLGYPQSSRPLFDPLQGRPTLLERQPTTGSSYSGSFDPFGESGEASSLNFAAAASSSGAFGDEDRKTSRFGFARRQDSTAGSIASTSSPLQVLAQPSALDIPTQTSFYSSNTNHSPALSHATSWSAHRQDFPTRNGISRTNSPFTQQGQAQQAYPPQARYQPYDQGVTEAQLRELIRKNTASQSRLGEYDSIISSTPSLTPTRWRATHESDAVLQNASPTAKLPRSGHYVRRLLAQQSDGRRAHVHEPRKRAEELPEPDDGVRPASWSSVPPERGTKPGGFQPARR